MVKASKEDDPHFTKKSESMGVVQPSLETQLDGSVRSLELDIFNGPAGWSYMLSKGGPNISHLDITEFGHPGFKVLYMTDFQFRSNYAKFKDTLLTIKACSDKHPDHFPIL